MQISLVVIYINYRSVALEMHYSMDNIIFKLQYEVALHEMIV